jgi:hypothetical protein
MKLDSGPRNCGQLYLAVQDDRIITEATIVAKVNGFILGLSVMEVIFGYESSISGV